MPAPPPRSTLQRKADTLEKLSHEVDCWVASASATGNAYIVPLSYVWDGRWIVLSTRRDSRTGRYLERTRKARLAWGPTRDVVIVEGPVEVIARDAVDPALADAFATATGFDPRQLPAEPAYAYFAITPKKIQAWREENELAGRDIMIDGGWCV